MKIEDQVCSLDLAKRLKELGVEQDSYFYHYHYDKEHILSAHHDSINWVLKNDPAGPIFSAFTVAELLEKMPDQFTLKKEGDAWYADSSGLAPFMRGDTAADACADYLREMIEQGLVKVEEK